MTKREKQKHASKINLFFSSQTLQRIALVRVSWHVLAVLKSMLSKAPHLRGGLRAMSRFQTPGDESIPDSGKNAPIFAQQQGNEGISDQKFLLPYSTTRR